MPNIRRISPLIAVLASIAVVLPASSTTAAARGRISLEVIGTFRTGVFAESAAEIVAHDPESQRLFVVNANAGVVDILDIEDPTSPEKVGVIEPGDLGAQINSVDIDDGVVAVAIEPHPNQNPGRVAFYDTAGVLLSDVQVGSLPDMLTFTPDGSKVVVANEGEPDGYCAGGVDPPGSVSIIDLSGGAAGVEQSDVATASFERFNKQRDRLVRRGVRIFGPGATVAQDLEPEYVAVAKNSSRAWVSLQENNALAVVNLSRARVTDILSLGLKDHSRRNRGIDASDDDGEINIQRWPVRGVYMPDALDAIKHKGRQFILSANEGDARDYECFAEEERVEDVTLDESVFEDADELQQEASLGRLTVTTTAPQNRDGEFQELHAFGGRSFSVWNASGRLVFDSGDDFEQVTADALPEDFNSDNEANDSFDNRSDNKGPEPEAIEIGQVGSRTYAFIGLERVGGVMIYDVQNPRKPRFVDYVNNRDFDGDPEADTAGDLGPEGLTLIADSDSPNGRPLLVVANEVSGSTTIYEVRGQNKAR
ncbi:MAG: choice-of-anchor I family protein [Actinomycetota bacterium]